MTTATANRYYELVAGCSMCIACGEKFATPAEADACLVDHHLLGQKMDEGDVASMLHDRFCHREHASDDGLYPGDDDLDGREDLPTTPAPCFYFICDREHAPQTGMAHTLWEAHEPETIREHEIWQVKARIFNEFADLHTIPLPEFLALMDKIGFGGG